MRVAVTGGAGFIGRNVVNRLKNQGHAAHVIDRAHGIDICDQYLAAAFKDCDAVVHLAGILGTSEMFQFPRRSIDTNITGTLNVLEECSAHGMAYVGITMPDSHWPSIYQATKLAATRLASAYAHRYGIPTTHARAYNAYGIGQAHGHGHPRKVVPTLATHSWQGIPMPIYGDGTQTVDLVHVDHIAHCLVMAATSPEEMGCDQTWDAGSGSPLTVLEVAALVGDVTGNHDVTHLPMRAGETPQTELCAKDAGPFGFDSFDMDRFARVVHSYKPQ